MKRTLRNFLVTAALALGMVGQASAQTRIMPLGDSITQGGQGYVSYRYELWFDLIASGFNVDFVGQRDFINGGSPNLAWYPDYLTTFDRDHEGYWGWRTDQIATIILGAATAAMPDIVLVHLGTNDIGQMGAPGVTNADTYLRQIIGVIRSVVPNVTIVLAQVIPIGPGGSYYANAGQVGPLNAVIATIAADSSTVSSPVILVDQNSGFDLGTMMQSDGIHPNLAGEAEMSDVWMSALVPLLSPSNLSPTVSITAPADGEEFVVPATVSVMADAADPDGSITHVRFYADTTLIGVDTAAPYAANWSTAAAGVYDLTAVASDDSGATATSVAVRVSVLPFAGGSPIVIANPSFESPVLADGALSEGPGVIDGWTFSGTADTYTGIFNPPSGSYPSAGGDGTPTGGDSTNVAYLFNDGGPSDSVSGLQVLTDSLVAGKQYLLTVAIGRFLPDQPYSFSTFGGYCIELLAGSTVIASAEDEIDPPTGEFRDAFAFVSSNDVDSVLFGSPLSIRLDISANDAPRSTHFDNVRLLTRDTPTGVVAPPGRETVGVCVYPNPFNPTTTIGYTVSTAGPVTISVHDVRGRIVDVIIDRVHHEAGDYRTVYRARGGSGVYFVRIDSTDQSVAVKALLLK